VAPACRSKPPSRGCEPADQAEVRVLDALARTVAGASSVHLHRAIGVVGNRRLLILVPRGWAIRDHHGAHPYHPTAGQFGGSPPLWPGLAPPISRLRRRNRVAWQRLQPARWPDPAYPQQAHLDLLVDDLDTGEARALQLGASRLSGGERFRVFADPAGHPFCLVRLVR
jgi:Glyoxalase-like domain